MTGPVTTEALVEKLARDLAREGGWNDPDAPWTENQVIIARGGAGQPVWRDFVDDARSLLGRETFTTLLAALQQVTAERDEARATDRESVRKRLIEAHEQLCKIDADGELPVRARDKSPPDTLRAVAERAVRMLEEIRAEDAAKGRPWWGHTLAKFALDDLVYALAELPDPEASLAAATSELARLRAEGEAKDRRIAELSEALAPFAKAGGLFGPRQSNGWDVLIYSPAAGDEYCITADHLRAARAATAREG